MDIFIFLAGLKKDPEYIRIRGQQQNSLRSDIPFYFLYKCYCVNIFDPPSLLTEVSILSKRIKGISEECL